MFKEGRCQISLQPPPSYAEIVNDKAGDTTEYDSSNAAIVPSVSSCPGYPDVETKRDNIDRSEATTHNNQVNTKVEGVAILVWFHFQYIFFIHEMRVTL